MDNSALSLTDQFFVDPANYEMDDWSQFYKDYGQKEYDSGKVAIFDDTPDSLMSNIINTFTGTKTRAWEEYQRQKEAKLRAYEEAKLSSARQYQEYLESSKYQRTMADIKAAGYNPWLALQSGVGSSTISSAPGSGHTNARYSSGKKNDQDLLNLSSSAMKLVALLAMMAGV